MMLDYGYGFNAIRDGGRGAQTIGLLVQINLERTKSQYIIPGEDTGIRRSFGDFMNSIQ